MQYNKIKQYSSVIRDSCHFDGRQYEHGSHVNGGTCANGAIAYYCEDHGTFIKEGEKHTMKDSVERVCYRGMFIEKNLTCEAPFQKVKNVGCIWLYHKVSFFANICCYLQQSLVSD